MELYRKDLEVDSEADIISAFKTDYGYELVEQNTTDCYTDSSCIIKIKDKYYKVLVEFTMFGAWQDIGDKLYTIDSIDKVTYKEVKYEDIVLDFNSEIQDAIKVKHQEIAELTSKLIKGH